MHTQLWPENIGRRDHLDNIGVDGRIISVRILKKLNVKL
jgi:hypothetical protein